ncbi:MAG: lipocalin-like domain-containing protein [Bacteroidota bacterium]
MKTITAKSKIIAIAFTISVSLSTGIFAQSDWKAYPYSPPGSVLTFPDDDGMHMDLSITTEWWYLNMHLIGSAPNYNKYDVMLCYFYRPAIMRIFNIADPSSGTFNTNVNQTPFILTPQAGHWDLSYNILFQISDYSNWTYPSDNITCSYFFHVEEPVKDDGLDVTLTSNRPPLVIGGNGFVPIGGQGDSSFYYTYSNMKVEGTIKYNGVEDVITSGLGWIDRQWGPFTVGTNPDNMYEWFSLQMDIPGTTLGIPQSPSEFNIWQIFSDTNSIPYLPQWRLVSAMYPDTTQDTSSSFIFERTGYWHDQADDKYYSLGWRFINPLRGVNIDITPTIDDQVVDVTLFKFWEGSTELKGTVENQAVEGVGFAELVAGHDYEIIPPSSPTGLIVLPDSNHFSLNWSASSQGTYPPGGYRIYRSSTNEGYWQYIATTTDLFYDDYSASLDSGYYYTVSSFDDQTATSGSNYASPVLVSPSGINVKPVAHDEIAIYPNPVTDELNIVVSFNYPVLFNIYDVIGRQIKSIEIEEKHTKISIDNISDGIYIYQIVCQKGNVINRGKLVVN